MKCSHCGKDIALIPSASERARKFGGVPSDYTRLFTIHSDCFLTKQAEETLTLMRSL